MKDRKYEYDNLKGILIYLVVLGHLLISFTHETSKLTLMITSFIYTFHMPIFFIVSGYFSKKKITKENAIKLLLIFILMNVSFSFYDYLIFGKMQLFAFKYASWYILLLLIYRLIINNKYTEVFRKKPFIVFIISLLIGGLFQFINTDLFILRIFENWIYFITGYLLINIDLKKYKFDKKYLYLLFIFLIFINGYIALNYYKNINFFLGNTYTLKQDLIAKMILIISNIGLFIVSREIISKKNIPILTNIGKNSLYIYMLHRIPTLLISEVLIPNRKLIIILDIIIALVLCIIFSLNLLVKIIDKLLNRIVDLIKNKNLIAVLLIILMLIGLVLFEINTKRVNNIDENDNKDISIVFVGDLILLEDQVKLSKNTFNYNFDYMFKYTKKYFEEADYSIGVFEGPSDDTQGYSIGNYNDNVDIHINHPGNFINSIKDAGIDLVTTSNNHVYDKGYAGTLNTIKNLEDRGLDYIGTGINNTQRKIVDIQGKRVGFLAYTFYSNYPNDTNNQELVKYLVDPKSNEFLLKKEEIKKDFNYLQKKKVDFIIVLPHYGSEFNFDFDNYQEEWNKVFTSFGANLILGDHSHVIGPLKYYGDTLAISSPGNYVNSYNGQDSDISDLVKITISKKDNSIKKVSLIPLLGIKDDKGYYPASLYDLKDTKNSRVEEALTIFGKTIFNDENIELKEEYEFSNNLEEDKLELNDNDYNSTAYKLINESNRICFIGDSITEGTKNDYHGWFEPLMSYFDKEVINISKGSYTTYDILNDFSNDIKESNCDLSIINIGTNDIRYNKTSSKDYKDNINKIINLTDGKVILLSPWETYNGDKIIGEDILEKKDLYGEYNKELIKISKKSDKIYYINPIRYIKSHIKRYGEDYYLLDGVHPDNNKGIELYSFSILRGTRY